MLSALERIVYMYGTLSQITFFLYLTAEEPPLHG